MIISNICKECKKDCCQGCKYLTDTGCSKTYENRFIACKIYPFWIHNNELFVCLSCPYWYEFLEYELEVRELTGLY